jgi:hypothetical protein
LRRKSSDAYRFGAKIVATRLDRFEVWIGAAAFARFGSFRAKEEFFEDDVEIVHRCCAF